MRAPQLDDSQELKMSRLDTWKFALAAGITFAASSVACAVAVAVSADATIAIFNSWAHGIDLARLVPPGGRPITVGQVIAGAFSLGAGGFSGGAILAACYNLLTAHGSGQALPSRRAT
jgi:hypothetical protein